MCVHVLVVGVAFFSLSYPQFKYKFIYSFIHCALQQTSVSFRFYIAVVLTKNIWQHVNTQANKTQCQRNVCGSILTENFIGIALKPHISCVHQAECRIYPSYLSYVWHESCLNCSFLRWPQTFCNCRVWRCCCCCCFRCYWTEIACMCLCVVGFFSFSIFFFVAPLPHFHYCFCLYSFWVFSSYRFVRSSVECR